MYITIISKTDFDLLAFLQHLPIPQDSLVFQYHNISHFFDKFTETHPQLFGLDLSPFITLHGGREEWQDPSFSIQQWLIHPQEKMMNTLDPDGFIMRIKIMLENSPYSGIIPKFEAAVRHEYELLPWDEWKMDEHVSPNWKQESYVPAYNLDIWECFWHIMWEEFVLRAQSERSLQALFDESACYPIYSEASVNDRGIDPPRKNHYCSICKKTKRQDLMVSHTICRECYVPDYFSKISSPTGEYLIAVIDKYSELSRTGAGKADSRGPRLPTLQTWDYFTPDFQRWFQGIPSWHEAKILSHDLTAEWHPDNDLIKAVTKRVEQYAIVLSSIRAESINEIGAFVAVNKELWIRLAHHYVHIHPHATDAFRLQTSYATKQEFEQALSQEQHPTTYSRKKMGTADFYILGFLHIVRGLYETFQYEEWNFSDGDEGSANGLGGFWIGNSKGVPASFLEDEGFLRIPFEDIQVQSWGEASTVLTLKCDGIKPLYPYDESVEGIFKLFFPPPGINGGPPEIYYKPLSPSHRRSGFIVFKVPDLAAYLWIRAGGVGSKDDLAMILRSLEAKEDFLGDKEDAINSILIRFLRKRETVEEFFHYLLFHWFEVSDTYLEIHHDVPIPGEALDFLCRRDQSFDIFECLFTLDVKNIDAVIARIETKTQITKALYPDQHITPHLVVYDPVSMADKTPFIDHGIAVKDNFVREIQTAPEFAKTRVDILSLIEIDPSRRRAEYKFVCQLDGRHHRKKEDHYTCENCQITICGRCYRISREFIAGYNTCWECGEPFEYHDGFRGE